MLTLGFLGVVRFRSRLFSFHRLQARFPRPGPHPWHRPEGRRPGSQLVRGPYAVTSLVSSALGLRPGNRRLAGLPILGELEEIASLITRYGIHQVIVAAEGASVLARRLVDLCVDVDVRLRIVPDLDELFTGYDGGPDIRDLELDDLLLRPSVSTDLEAVESILHGKTVLVTGAGGSIGSEIVAQVLRFMPDTSWRWTTTRPISTTECCAGITGRHDLVPALCDLRDEDKLRSLIAKYKPHVVYHAAAHKHVPILEKWPDEAVKTNVVGTANLIDAVRGTHREIRPHLHRQDRRAQGSHGSLEAHGRDAGSICC